MNVIDKWRWELLPYSVSPAHPLTSCTHCWCMTRCCDFVYKHRTGNLVLTHMPSIKMTTRISSSTKSYSETHCGSMEALPICLCDTSPCWLRLPVLLLFHSSYHCASSLSPPWQPQSLGTWVLLCGFVTPLFFCWVAVYRPASVVWSLTHHILTPSVCKGRLIQNLHFFSTLLPFHPASGTSTSPLHS